MISVYSVLYWITPALDRYILLLDRTPHTWMMTLLNICGTVSYNLQHPLSHPSLLYLYFFHTTILHPSGLLLSELTTCGHKHPWLIPMKISYHPWSCHLSLTCGTYYCGGNVENVVEETDIRDHKGDKVPLEDIECHLWKIVFKEMFQFSLIYPPIWFSRLKSKNAMLIL